MDNGQEGSPPPTRDGRGNPRRVIGIRRINYSGTGLPPVETASSPEDIHSGGASTSESLPEKQGESPEPPSPPELPTLNQEEIQAFYRESLLAMQAADSARKLVSSTTPDNELVFYDSESSGSQAANSEPVGSRSDMAESPHNDRASFRSVVSDDLKSEDARSATSPGVHSSRANTPTTDASISRATAPAADDSVSRATTPAANDSVSRATTPAADDSFSRATTPAADDSISRATAPAADDSISRATTPAAEESVSRATAPAADDNTLQNPVNAVKSSTRETTGFRKRIRRAFSRLFRPFRSCFGHS